MAQLTDAVRSFKSLADLLTRHPEALVRGSNRRPMRHLCRLRLAVALCATLIAASCSSPDPTLYTIAPVPGTVVSGAPKVIAVHGVGVAQYLPRSPIVQTSGDYRIVPEAQLMVG